MKRKGINHSMKISRMRDKFTPQEQKLWLTFQFFLRLLILSAPIYLVLLFLVDMTALQLLVAGNSAWLLGSLGWHIVQEGPLLNLGTFSFIISPDCTGWKSILFLFALLFAVPHVSGKKRLLGLVIGIPVLWAGNLGRILLTVLVQDMYGFELAVFVHDYLWRLGLVVLVLLIWGVWLSKALIRERKQK